MNIQSSITGWGADARRENRPGVPEELTPPHPLGNPHWNVPEQQTTGPVAAKSAFRKLTLLILADRIDVIEHSMPRAAAVAGLVALGVLGVRGMKARRRVGFRRRMMRGVFGS
jgi:hypothetical protein